MNEDTRSLLTMLALIFGSAALSFCVILAMAAYCFRGDE